MPVTYRPAQAIDLEPAMQVVQVAINNLRVRNGMSSDFVAGSPHFQKNCLTYARDGLWIAEEAGQLVGFGFSWMCQDFWYLSQLFVLPGTQSKGVGQQLLDHTLGLAGQRRVGNKALITFAYNMESTGLYIRNGLFPQEPLYRWSGPSSVVAQRIGEGPYKTVPLGCDAESVEWIGRVDAANLGFRRDAHHLFQLQTAPETVFRIDGTKGPAGYCYVSSTGHVGPLAVVLGADPRESLRAAVQRALTTNAQNLTAIVPGSADALLRGAGDFGLRLSEPLMLMATRPFGNWRNYMPSNPGRM